MAAANSDAGLSIVDHNKGPAILATFVTVTVISTLFVGARLFTRAYIIKKLYLDDYFIFLSMVCALVFLSVS
jgi:hypothetical protein